MKNPKLMIKCILALLTLNLTKTIFDINVLHRVIDLAFFAYAILCLRGMRVTVAIYPLLIAFFLSIISTTNLSFFLFQPAPASMTGLAITVKPIFYLATTAIIAGYWRKRPASLYQIYFTFGQALSAALVASGIYLAITNGLPIKASVISESNYDAALGNICFVAGINSQQRVSKQSQVLYAAGILATGSLTGIVTFIALLCVTLTRVSKLNSIVLIAVALQPILYLITSKINKFGALEHIDRVKFATAFYEYITTSSIGTLLFGKSGAGPLVESLSGLEWFIAHQSKLIGITGVHSSNFHSYILRVISDYGLFGVLFMLLFVCFKMPIRRLVIFLTLIAFLSTSLAVHYLTLLGIPLFLLIETSRKSRLQCQR